MESDSGISVNLSHFDPDVGRQPDRGEEQRVTVTQIGRQTLVYTQAL